MKLFKCNHCGQPVFFENYFCVQCNASLGFDPQQMAMVSLQLDSDNCFIPLNGGGKTDNLNRYKYCVNKQQNVCNWLLAHNDTAQYCFACNLNRTIPDLGQPDHWAKWYQMEVAKHRLVYSLLRFRLPVISKFQDEENGIAFDFKANENKGDGKRLLTGHDNGLITLNIDEADDVIREMARNQMDEVYRTVLGHFRHEIGHYYWDRLIKNTNRLQPFRKLFGDESEDYAAALKKHYSQPASDGWKQEFISAYSGAHPWEDWAETWAHYMHIIDTLETGYSFGISVNPRIEDTEQEMSTRLNFDPYTTQSFDEILEGWIPLSYAMNSLNRSMGMKDLYPFVINDPVRQKLKFIHETIRGQ